MAELEDSKTTELTNMPNPLQVLPKRLASRLPWVSAPLVVGAPMRVLAGPELAVAISAAGGLGFLGPAAKAENMKNDLENVRNLTAKVFKSSGSSAATTSLPIGVGFQLWSDDVTAAAQLIEEYRPSVAWLYAPDDEQEDYATWSTALRRASPDIAIWVQIGTVAEARLLLESSELPDALVVQGTEAGGHGRAEDGIGLITLFPEVAERVAHSGHNIPLLAAGGIVDGRGATAAFGLGADGVALGTRFLASFEARISRGYQDEIVRATNGGVATTRTLLYNQLRGTVGWPKNYSPRTIINRSYIDHKNGTAFETLKELHDEAVGRGDEAWGLEGRTATYASASVGLIHDVRHAGSIVKDIQAEVITIVRKLNVEGARL